MKKYLASSLFISTVFLLSACRHSGDAAPKESALVGSWRLDSVSLASDSDRKTSLAVLLLAMSAKDSINTELQFDADSVALHQGSEVQRLAYRYTASKLVLTDTARQEWNVRTLNDSALVLEQEGKLALHLRRVMSAQDQIRPR